MAEDTIEKLKKLTKRLNDAAEAYYQQDREIMTNFEYDALYDRACRAREGNGHGALGKPNTACGLPNSKFFAEGFA